MAPIALPWYKSSRTLAHPLPLPCTPHSSSPARRMAGARPPPSPSPTRRRPLRSSRSPPVRALCVAAGSRRPGCSQALQATAQTLLPWAASRLDAPLLPCGGFSLPGGTTICRNNKKSRRTGKTVASWCVSSLPLNCFSIWSSEQFVAPSCCYISYCLLLLYFLNILMFAAANILPCVLSF